MRRKYMVCAAYLISVCDRGLFADKERTVITQPFDQSKRIAHMHLHMLERVLIGYSNKLVFILNEDNLTAVYPTRSGHLLRRDTLEVLFNPFHHRRPEIEGTRDQNRARLWVMLRLPDKIAAHQEGVGGIVSYNADLSRAGKQVNAHASKQLAFRLHHVLVTGTDDHIHRGEPG